MSMLKTNAAKHVLNVYYIILVTGFLIHAYLIQEQFVGKLNDLDVWKNKEYQSIWFQETSRVCSL